jgi:hypothetical protein
VLAHGCSLPRSYRAKLSDRRQACDVLVVMQR